MIKLRLGQIVVHPIHASEEAPEPPHAINMQIHNPICNLSPVIIFASLIIGLRLTECACHHIDNYQACAVISDLDFTGLRNGEREC